MSRSPTVWAFAGGLLGLGALVAWPRGDGEPAPTAAPASAPRPPRVAAAAPTPPREPNDQGLVEDGRIDWETPLEDPSGRALARFHAALRRARKGADKARVVVYGASHAACDHYVGYLREALQRKFGDGGRGFTLAAWPNRVHHFWQWGAQVAPGTGWARLRLGARRAEPDHYGLAGIVFDSRGEESEAQLETAPSGVGARADRIVVLFQKQVQGGRFDVQIDGALARTVSTAASRVGAGYAEFKVPEGPHRLRLRAHPGASVRVYGAVFERSTSGVVVDNAALTGAFGRHHLKWMNPVYADHLRYRDPDLLILAYGGNEGNDFHTSINTYAKRTLQVVRRLRETVPQADCLLLGPPDKPYRARSGDWSHRSRTTAIIRVQRDVAGEMGCAFFDTAAFMGGRLSMLEWVDADPPLARDDYVHLSAKGYRQLGEVLLRRLLEGVE